MALRLNLACGGSRWPGFENSDINGQHGVTYLDLEQYPYPYEDDSAEVVMMSHALFMSPGGKPLHPDLGRIMAECFRILQPGGWLRIDDNPVRCYDRNDPAVPAEVDADLGRGYPVHLRVTRQSLRDILAACGFTRVVDVPQGETNIPCDGDLRASILGNRLFHVSFTLEAQK